MSGVIPVPFKCLHGLDKDNLTFIFTEFQRVYKAYWKANHTAQLGSKVTCVMNEDVEQSLAVLLPERPQGKPRCASNDIGMLRCAGVVTLT